MIPPTPNDQVREYLQALPPKQNGWWNQEISSLRLAAREEAIASGGEPEEVSSVETIDAGGIPARLYRPLGDENGVLIWFHGGGWILGDLESSDPLVRALANRAGCAVLVVDYRLAPEHRYPSAIEDCWLATTWAASQFDILAVGGDSAGGNLAAAVALRARDNGVPLVLQLLVYPVLDYRVESSSYNDYRRRYALFVDSWDEGTLSQDGIRFCWDTYVPDPARRVEPDASPLRASSLRGVANAFIITAEHDILREEADEFALRLTEDHVPVDTLEYQGQIHGFVDFLGVMDDALDAVELSAEALRNAINADYANEHSRN